MRRYFTISLLALLLSTAAGAAVPALHVIPQPQKVEMAGKGSFKVSGAQITYDAAVGDKVIKMVEEFSDHLYMVTGKASSVAPSVGLKAAAESGVVKGIIFVKDDSLAPEAYSINVTSKSALLRASSDQGFFYALQTFKQLLPKEIFGGSLSEKAKWYIPCCTIDDAPRFGYRGMHLDCSRHFFSVAEIKKYLDIMALYKLNTLHWHLTDDQGWRIEVKSYPKLTEIGAYRNGTIIGTDRNTNDGIRYGGYYTQDQIRDIIRYAGERCITVIPEVDLPGHMLAALASYPELGCTGGPYEVWHKWGITDQVLCPGKEGTFKFLEAVLGEIAELFPSPYFHIGGDECKKTQWEKCPDCQARIKELGIVADENTSAEQYLQNYVTTRVEKFLSSKGKKVIGWDEIIDGNLTNNAIVMSWRGTKGGIKAAKNGYDAIMTPYSHCYFDYRQSDSADEPLGGSRVISTETTYGFEPLEGLTPEEGKHILGVQANLWTEFITTDGHLEYMLLPRMLALSEVQWCQPEVKDFGRFSENLRTFHYPILDVLGYNYKRF